MILLNLCYIAIRIVDIIDILLVATLLFILYRLLRGTSAINIFFGIIAIILLWKIVEIFDMKILSEILGAFISVGFIALIVVFQPEIRAFLLMLGKPLGNRYKKRHLLFNKFVNKKPDLMHDIIIKAAYKLAESGTGSIIILTRENLIPNITVTGEQINGDISIRLIENLFYKNSPLHDGAIVITNKKIISAACILPISKNSDLPSEYGLRHRSAIGITEQTDAVAIITSEQRKTVSLSAEGHVFDSISSKDLTIKLEELFGY